MSERFVSLTCHGSHRYTYARTTDHYIRLVTYNTDGLDGGPQLLARAEAAASILLDPWVPFDGLGNRAARRVDQTPIRVPADAILLQEVTVVTAPVFISALAGAGYSCYPSELPPRDVGGYFTLVFLRCAFLGGYWHACSYMRVWIGGCVHSKYRVPPSLPTDRPTLVPPSQHTTTQPQNQPHKRIKKRRDDRFTVLTAERRPFPNSKMGRDLVKVILLIA